MLGFGYRYNLGVTKDKFRRYPHPLNVQQLGLHRNCCNNYWDGVLRELHQCSWRGLRDVGLHQYRFGQSHEVALAYGYDWLCVSDLELLRAKFEHLSSDEDPYYSLYIGYCTTQILILISHGNDPYKPISIMECQKGFERCSFEPLVKPRWFRCITCTTCSAIFICGHLISLGICTPVWSWQPWLSDLAEREKNWVMSAMCDESWCHLPKMSNPLITTMSDFLEASDDILQGLWDASLARFHPMVWIISFAGWQLDRVAVTAAHFCSKWHDMMGVTTFWGLANDECSHQTKDTKKNHVKWWLECPKTQSVWWKCFGPFLAKRAVSSKKNPPVEWCFIRFWK